MPNENDSSRDLLIALALIPWLTPAGHLAAPLARSGGGAVPGWARGVDAAAHRAARAAGAPTIAVRGTGIDVIYPKRHGRLSRAIEERGLIVSEFPAGTPPLPP